VEKNWVGGIKMKLHEIKSVLNANLLTNKVSLDLDVNYVFGCDLMSDVLSLVAGETMLLTGLVNIQAVRTAEMKDIKCVVFVRGKVPEQYVIELAKEKGICLMSTKHIMFTSCGILYRNGLKGAEIE
jgi:predicted transcriptional regulator